MSQAQGWENRELDGLDAGSMDARRIQSFLDRINDSMSAVVTPDDVRKLQQLKVFFEKELQRRRSQ